MAGGTAEHERPLAVHTSGMTAGNERDRERHDDVRNVPLDTPFFTFCIVKCSFGIPYVRFSRSIVSHPCAAAFAPVH